MCRLKKLGEVEHTLSMGGRVAVLLPRGQKLVLKKKTFIVRAQNDM